MTLASPETGLESFLSGNPRWAGVDSSRAIMPCLLLRISIGLPCLFPTMEHLWRAISASFNLFRPARPSAPFGCFPGCEDQ